MKLLVKVIVFSCALSFASTAQNIQDFFLYSYDHALFNPAAAGAENKHVIGLNGRIDLRENFRENDMVPYTGMFSYNGNISPLNSGIGLYSVVERDWAYTTSKVGVSYNYKIKLAPKASVRIGVRPTFSKHTIDYGRYYDAIDFTDPLLRDDKVSETKPDLDLGVWFDILGFYLGGTLNNTFKHEYQSEPGNSKYGDRYSAQTVTVIAGRKFNVPGFEVDPSVAFFKHSTSSYINLSNNFTFGNIFIVGGTYITSLDNDFYNISINSGVSIANRVQLVTLVYTRDNHRPNSSDSMFFEGMIRVKI